MTEKVFLLFWWVFLFLLACLAVYGMGEIGRYMVGGL